MVNNKPGLCYLHNKRTMNIFLYHLSHFHAVSHICNKLDGAVQSDHGDKEIDCIDDL